VRPLEFEPATYRSRHDTLTTQPLSHRASILFSYYYYSTYIVSQFIVVSRVVEWGEVRTGAERITCLLPVLDAPLFSFSVTMYAKIFITRYYHACCVPSRRLVKTLITTYCFGSTGRGFKSPEQLLFKSWCISFQ